MGLALLCPTSLIAQVGGYSTLFLNIKDSNKAPVAFTDIWLIDAATAEEQEGTTDRKGKVHFGVDPGSSYFVLFDKSEKHSEIKVPKTGSSIVTKTLVYNPPIPEFPGEITMDTVAQSLRAQQKPSRSEALFILKLRHRNKRPVANIPVCITSSTHRKVYTALTDRSGNARFLIRPNAKYLIGLEDWSDYSRFTFPDYPGGTFTKTITFEPSNVVETVANDTVRQEVTASDEPSSARFLVTVQVNNYAGEPLEGEELTFDVEDSSRVYIATTNNKGVARALLPKKMVYDVHLKYEGYLAHYDFRDKRGFGNVEVKCRYRGTAAIEAYLQTVQRDSNGIPLSFEPGSIQPEVPDGMLTVKATENGFEVTMRDAQGVSTPGVVNDRIFISHGIYSNLFHCLDANNGNHLWTVALSEGGASAMAYEDGVVLVNTESCTLYALDANTGRMLWSHWLSPYLWTTPSVKDGRVFAVYANSSMNFQRGGEKIGEYVLACFALKSGSVLWQKPIQAEGIGAPVVTNSSVYVATKSGTLHKFNVSSGVSKKTNNLRITSPPTVIGDRLFATQLVGEGTEKEQVVVLEANTLMPISVYPHLSGASHWKNLMNSYHVYCMHHQGAQALHYQGQNYQVLGNQLVCSNPTNGTVVWKLDLPKAEGDAPLATMPSIAGKHLILTTRSGKVLLVNPNSGQITRTYDTNETLWSQAVVANGNIYSGSSGKTLECIQTGISTLDGWGQWGLNGAHNPVVTGVTTN